VCYISFLYFICTYYDYVSRYALNRGIGKEWYWISGRTKLYNTDIILGSISRYSISFVCSNYGRYKLNVVVYNMPISIDELTHRVNILLDQHMYWKNNHSHNIWFAQVMEQTNTPPYTDASNKVKSQYVIIPTCENIIKMYKPNYISPLHFPNE